MMIQDLDTIYTTLTPLLYREIAKFTEVTLKRVKNSSDVDEAHQQQSYDQLLAKKTTFNFKGFVTSVDEFCAAQVINRVCVIE